MSNDTRVKWLLYDVYKVASSYPLQISLFGHILSESYLVTLDLDSSCSENRNERMVLTEKFLSKSTRDDLQGLTLSCGLVVSLSEWINLIVDIPTRTGILVWIISDSVSRTLHVPWGPKCRKCRYFYQRNGHCCCQFAWKFEHELQHHSSGQLRLEHQWHFQWSDGSVSTKTHSNTIACDYNAWRSPEIRRIHCRTICCWVR